MVSHGLGLRTPQPLIGYRTPSASEWFPPGNRRIDAEATYELMLAVGNHSETALLHRAIEAYRRALAHWVPEQRLMAGEFLFICAETLSRFMIEARAAALGITPKNLAQKEKAANQDDLRDRYLTDEIFAGDAETHTAMNEASNGFEHGYMAVGDVRGMVEPVLERSIGLVRRALRRAAPEP